MKLRNKLKLATASVMIALGSLLPAAVPIFAQDRDPKLTVTVKGAGYVQVSEKDSGKSKFALTSSPYEATVPKGTLMDLNCIGDGQVVKELSVNGEVQPLDYGKEELSFEYEMPGKDAAVNVIFEDQDAASLKAKTATQDDTAVQTENEETRAENSVKLPDTGQFELRTEQEKALDQYSQGDYESSLQLRKDMVKTYGLEDYVDNDWFLTDAFFDEFGPYGTSWGGMLILSPKVKKDYEPKQEAVIAKAAGSVIKFNEHFWHYSGGYMTAGSWDVSTPSHGTQLAFCANGMQAPPPTGTAIDTPVKQNNENLRKALYYGYNGPQNRLTQYSSAQQVVFTNDLVSMSTTGNCISKGIGGGWIWNQYVSSLWNQLQTWPSPPADFVAYIANTHGSGMNWQGITTPYQPLAYGVFEQQTGHLGIVKSSSIPGISDGNDNYDLKTAEYTLYSDAACTKAVKVFRLNNVGGGGKVYDGPYAFPIGTYYLKETKTATGFALDPRVYTVKVEATGVTHPSGAYPNWKDFEVSDIPQSDPVDVLLSKVDNGTGQNRPQGNGSLANAQFTFKFYVGKTPDLNGAAARTWIMKTDQNGQVKLQDTYKVSGDAFYKNSADKPTLPLGTLVIQETKAPAGYYLNGTKYTVKVTGSGTSETVKTYNKPIVREQVNELILTKVQTGTNTGIPGTIFTWTKPDGKTEDVKTDDKGQLKLTGMATGIHRLKEKAVMDGYEINPEEFSFEVTESGITSKTDVAGKDMAFVAGNTNGQSAQLTVSDKVSAGKLKLIKVNEHDKKLPGAEFTLYADEACTKPLAVKTTDSSGVMIFDEIKDRTDYWFKETKAPEGYRIPVDSRGEPHVYKLRAEYSPATGTYDFYVDGKKYTVQDTHGPVHLEDENGTKVISITVINYTSGRLPETGSSLTMLLGVAGGLLMIVGLSLGKKRKDIKK